MGSVYTPNLQNVTHYMFKGDIVTHIRANKPNLKYVKFYDATRCKKDMDCVKYEITAKKGVMNFLKKSWKVIQHKVARFPRGFALHNFYILEFYVIVGLPTR